MRRHVTTTSEIETIELGRALGERLRAGDVLALIGELGAGKTRFVRGVAIGLGLDPAVVSSPTYVLVNEYESPANERPTLVHVDAYRLRGAEELASLGWSQIQDQDAIVVIEWADRIERDLPTSALRIEFEHDADRSDYRRITLECGDSWAARLEGLPFQR